MASGDWRHAEDFRIRRSGGSPGDSAGGALGREPAHARSAASVRTQLPDHDRHACPRSQRRAAAAASRPDCDARRRIEPARQPADDLDRVARQIWISAAQHLAAVESQPRQERMLELEQRRVVKLHALLGRERLDQHAARDLDPDWFVGAVVEQEVERRLVEKTARRARPPPAKPRQRPDRGAPVQRRRRGTARDDDAAHGDRAPVGDRAQLRDRETGAAARPAGASRLASRTAIGPQAVDSAAAAPAAAAATPRSFAAIASIPHAASPAAAADVAAVANRTPRGNEIQRAIAPPVRTSADAPRRRRACPPPREAVGDAARSRSRCARPTAPDTRPRRPGSPVTTRRRGRAHPIIAARSLFAYGEVAFGHCPDLRRPTLKLQFSHAADLIIASCFGRSPSQIERTRPHVAFRSIQLRRSMVDADGSRQPLEVLRNAARGGQERFLVALGDSVERPAHRGRADQRRLRARGRVRARGSGAAGRRIVRPRDPGPPRRAAARRRPPAAGRDPLAAWRELRPFTDLVLIGDGDPMQCRPGVRARGRGGAAAAAARGRRAAARARQAAGRLPARPHARPAGAERLQPASGTSWPPPIPSLARRWTRWPGTRGATRRSSCSATRSWPRRRGRSATTPTRTSTVVGLRAGDVPDSRLGEARARAAGAALVVVDDAPTTGPAGERHLRRRARLPAAGGAGAPGAHRGLGRRRAATASPWG